MMPVRCRRDILEYFPTNPKGILAEIFSKNYRY
jgi:hypothetical protein